MSADQSKSETDVIFRCLDRNADIEKTQRNLPHWFKAGAAIFVTFRTADSMPQEVVVRFQSELQHWLTKNNLRLELAGQPGDCSASQNAATIVPNCSPQQQAEFKKLRVHAWNQSLDECHGSCLLRKPKLARIVADAILHHDDRKYDLDCFVIMPNHVHAIVQFRPGGSLQTVSQSWLRYTARQINFETGEKGEFWQCEPFDHIIRSPEQFSYLQSYIADNPARANLKDSAFLYWQRS